MSWLIKATGGALGLLDQYGNAAAAYSLRNLSIYYTGPVVRVRRSSDNTEQDFTAAQVEDGTLTAFCGAGNGFVRTWYDQSGNGLHGGQATTTSQPQIVSSGNIILSGSIRVLQFNGSTQFLSLPAGALNYERTQAFSFFAVANVANQNAYFIGKQQNSGTSTGWGVIHLASTGNPPGFAVQVRASSTSQAWHYATGRYNANTIFQAIYQGDSNADNIALAYNGVVQSGISFANNLTSSITNAVTATIGSRENGAVPLNGMMSELILYPNAQSNANRTGINSNINTHYNIF